MVLSTKDFTIAAELPEVSMSFFTEIGAFSRACNWK